MLLAGCASGPTRFQLRYLSDHPELTVRERGAIYRRRLAVGDSLDWVKLVVDGFTMRRLHGDNTSQTYQIFVPIHSDGLVLLREGKETAISEGEVRLVFRAGKVAQIVLFE